jgi:hypothetical protein
MTEDEWLMCRNPLAMMEHLEDRVDRRKRLLFACGCWRMCWMQVGEQTHTAVEAIEAAVERGNLEEGEYLLYADTGPGASESRSVWNPTGELIGPNHPDEAAAAAAVLVSYLTLGCWDELWVGVQEAERIAERFVTGGPAEAAWSRQREAQCRLLHDLVGNPFHVTTIEPAWLTWNENAIPKLATRIYTDRTFDHLSILADALEDAGCTDAAILTHCRGPGPHVRGCWVVDLLLGKS